MKKSVVGVFLGILAILLAATVCLAVPSESTATAKPTKVVTKKVRKKSADKTDPARHQQRNVSSTRSPSRLNQWGR